MSEQPWFHAFLETPGNSVIATEQVAINGLLAQGYELVTSSSWHHVFKKGEVTIELFYNPKDGGHELTVVPTAAGPAIFKWFLEKTSFLSEEQWHLTLHEFWTGHEKTVCFHGYIQEVLHLLSEIGYTYRPNNRAVVRQGRINIIGLKKDHPLKHLELQVAFVSRLSPGDYEAARTGRRPIWIHAFGRINILKVAAYLYRHQR